MLAPTMNIQDRNKCRKFNPENPLTNLYRICVPAHTKSSASVTQNKNQTA